MKWTTKVSNLDNLQSELRRLEDDSHTINYVLTVNGYIVIISTTV